MSEVTTKNSSTFNPAPFVGVGVALITLFDDERKVDIPATVEHAAKLVDLGVQAVLVSGTTGESKALTDSERNALLSGIVDEIQTER